MATMNHVFLMGHLTRDPAARQTPSGMAVADLGLAVNETYKNKAGEDVERTCFADVVVWGRQAEACAQYLAKGAPVLVEGRLQFEQWQTANGEKRSRLRVSANRIQFLNRAPAARKDEGAVAAGAPAAAAATAARADDPEETGGEAMPF